MEEHVLTIDLEGNGIITHFFASTPLGETGVPYSKGRTRRI
jgi:hypothetical protein